MTRERELAAALLWLRNHYDVGDRKLKPEVLRLTDLILDQEPVSGPEYGEFVDTVLGRKPA